MRPAYAARTHGRIIFGTTAVTERYDTNDFGSTSNDILVLSTRFFYKISEVGEDKWEYVLDFRDKHDMFGSLNKEKLQLESKNEFQTRQLYARWVNPDGLFSSQIGRFQVFESGSVFVDGASAEVRFADSFKFGLLGGLNPKSLEQSYLEYNSKATQTGAYLTYQSNNRVWNENKFATLGYVDQKFNSQSERRFLFNNFIYQWDVNSRVINTIYYDFVPSAKVQTHSLIYQQGITPAIKSEIGILHLDTIEYRRNQDLLERLAASPYDEARLELDFAITEDDNLGVRLLSGKRQIDNLKKEEVTLGYDMNNRFSKSFDIRPEVGYRRNFTSKDVIAKLALGYYSRNWEINFDNCISANTYDDGVKKNQLITDLGVTSYFSKQTYLNLSYQHAGEEGVQINTVFFRIGYRFGNQDIPPVRDGAPPRGAL